MSRDLGRDVPDLEKLYARKLWADSLFLRTTSVPIANAEKLPSANMPFVTA